MNRNMADNTKQQRLTATTGDAAVDGLLAGMTGGAVMVVYLIAANWLAGVEPGATLGLFSAGGTASPAVGLISHLAVSGVYGVIFGLVWRLVAQWLSWIPVWLAGVAYGLVLLALALSILLPAANSPLLAVPPIHFAIAHGLYGLTLGFVAGRRRAK